MSCAIKSSKLSAVKSKSHPGSLECPQGLMHQDPSGSSSPEHHPCYWKRFQLSCWADGEATSSTGLEMFQGTFLRRGKHERTLGAGRNFRQIRAAGRSCVYFVVSLLPLELQLRQSSSSEEANKALLITCSPSYHKKPRNNFSTSIPWLEKAALLFQW